jgi:transcriptional regulator with XRE-family HTH domain
MSASIRMVSPIDGVIEEIRVAMARKRWRQSDLARELEVTEAWVSRRLAAKVPLTIDDLYRFAAALGVATHDLLPEQRVTHEQPHRSPANYPAVRSVPGGSRRPVRLSSLAA